MLLLAGMQPLLLPVWVVVLQPALLPPGQHWDFVLRECQSRKQHITL